MIPRLYTYWRSSSAYRVRIALHLKGIEYEPVPVHLARDGGEQHRSDYTALNPQALVPTLEVDGLVLTQSVAIIEYLEDTRPEPALLPAQPAERAQVRALAQLVASELQPLNNLRVLNYLRDEQGMDEAVRNEWYRHWIAAGFGALEALLERQAGAARFCHGDSPTLADVCLVPQVYNARRYECDLGPYPRIRAIDEACRELPAFHAAAPEQQPDAP